MLSVRQTGEAWRTDTLRVDPATGAARWTLDALRGDLHLVATDGRASSDSVVIHAADRPFLGAVALRVIYPAYLGRPAENLPVGEPLRLPRGTVIDVSGRASVPLASVEPGAGVGTVDVAAGAGATRSPAGSWPTIRCGCAGSRRVRRVPCPICPRRSSSRSCRTRSRTWRSRRRPATPSSPPMAWSDSASRRRTITVSRSSALRIARIAASG